MLNTPDGTPASWKIRATAQPVPGVSSAHFITAALPHIRAGKAFQATLAMGVLAAMMRPHTPSGWRTISTSRSGVALVEVRPKGRAAVLLSAGERWTASPIAAVEPEPEATVEPEPEAAVEPAPEVTG